MKITQRQLTLKTGTEGPRHDPYGYEERIVELNEHTYKLHLGLACYAKEADETMVEGEEAVAWWVARTGLSPDEFDKAYLRLTEPPRRCPACRSKVEYHSGFVGESVACCANPACTTGIVWSEEVTESMIQ